MKDEKKIFLLATIPAWMETGSAAIIEQGILNCLSWLERLLARP